MYLAKTDPLGADVPNPVSHVAYGYATQVCLLKEDGKVDAIIAAHDVGKAVNPKACEGQIEGGVVMSLGFALTEQFPVVDCRPTAKFGTLGLFKADKIPTVKAILVEKPGLKLAKGAIGIGEITSILRLRLSPTRIIDWTASSGPPCPWRIRRIPVRSKRHCPA